MNTRRALVAGMAAGTAFLAATLADSRLSSYPYNDLKLVGQMFTTRSPWWQALGLAGHYGLSVVVALAYARWAYRQLPGPGWLRGFIFLQMENLALYPLAAISDRFHAGMRAGQLPPLLAWKSFWGQFWRHVAFGLVLGALYEEQS